MCQGKQEVKGEKQQEGREEGDKSLTREAFVRNEASSLN